MLADLVTEEARAGRPLPLLQLFGHPQNCLCADLHSLSAETSGGQKLHVYSPLDLWVKMGGYSSEVAFMEDGVK